jgi:ABC-2 type transport system permease protein
MSTAPPLAASNLRATGSTRSPVVRFAGLLRAEWTKIRSVRSTVWTLILFVVLTVGLTAGLTALVVGTWNNGGRGSANGHIQILLDPVGFVLGAGIGLGQLTICVLGVLLITTEYSTGVIRASLLAVPKRMPMLIAKMVVFAGMMVVLAEIVSFGSFFVGTALLHSKVAVSISDPNVIRAVVGAGLYLTVLGLFSLGIGLLFRHTAGAIATAIGAVFVLPILAGFLPDTWGEHINAYLPEQAGSVVFAAHAKSGQLLSAWEGFGVFCLWTVVLLGIGAYLLQRRDAS